MHKNAGFREGNPAGFATTITDEQRQEIAALIEETVRRIESGLFLPHRGIRFPTTPVSISDSWSLRCEDHFRVRGPGETPERF